MSRLRTVSNTTARRGQGLVEFALILPVLLLMIMGIVDFGRALFTYGQASSQMREALRQAAAIGLPGGGIPPYRDCPNMQAIASKVYFAQSIDNFAIKYARVNSVTPPVTLASGTDFTTFDTCSYPASGPGIGVYGPSNLANGDILRMNETVTIQMLTPFVPAHQLTFNLQGQRTVITSIDVATAYCGNLVCDPGEADPNGADYCLADCSQPDLHLSINGQSSVQTGSQTVYYINVKNDGSIDNNYNWPAPNVKVAYQLPDPNSVQYIGCGGAPCSVVGTQVIWDLGTVAWVDTTQPNPVYPQVTLTLLPKVPFVSPQLKIGVTVSTTGADPHPSTTINYSSCDPNPGDFSNQACFPTTVTSIPGDIFVNLTNDAPYTGADFDSNITFTISGYLFFSGKAGSPPTGVRLTISGLPTDFIFVSADAGVVYNKAAGTAYWDVPDGTAFPVIKQIKLQAHKDGTFKSSGDITWNTLSFSDIDNPTPGNPGNNHSDWNYIVKPPTADLSIRKQLISPNPATTTVGLPVVYNLIISNNSGTVVSAAPTVVDTFPDDPANPWAAVAYQSYTVSPKGSVTGFKLSGSHNTVATWTLGNMPPGSTVTITVNATTQSDGTWTNSAAVSSTTTDNNLSNNNDSVAVTTNILPPVTGLKAYRNRCTGTASRRYQGLIWNRVTGADGYYIYANGVLIGQTTDGTGKITSCGGSVARSRPRVVSGCYNLNPGAWKVGSTVSYTVEAFINIIGNLTQTGPASTPVSLKC